MKDAAIERLSKIISDAPTQDSGKDKRLRKSVPEIHFGLAEGWFSLFLLAAVVYSTIWSVQAAGWVAHLNILSLTTAIGLMGGVIGAKQRWYSRLLVHPVAIILGLLLSFWQTAGAFYNGNTAALAQGMHHWFMVAMSGGSVDDDSIFLFFIVALGFILAYISAWLVYRTRRPWLMVVANAILLLINLSNVDAGYIIYLVIFLIAALLLLLRFNLYESVQRWKRQGLRYADDIGWDIMQTGSLISIGILIVSWILPWGYTDATASQLWNTNSNPWIQVENTWNRVISLNGTSNPSNHGNFRDTLVLAGNPNLNHDVVLNVQSDDASQYLGFVGYDTYTGRGWTIGPTSKLSVKPNQVFPSGAISTHTVNQTVTVVNAPGEQFPYVLGASSISSMSVPANVLVSNASGAAVAWIAQNGDIPAGTHYNVASAVSSADVKTLQSVPLPANAPQYPADFDGPLPPTYYNPGLVSTFLQLPPNLDPHIASLARQITSNAPTMYDKALALETYLRTHYQYSVDIQLPPGEEGVSWFLYRSGNKGFCNYFASAMAVMARTMGMPARVVAGYTNGTYDPKRHQQVVYGTDAHSWVQVYFAGYGWINFEPSASFSTFARPLPNQFTGPSNDPNSNPDGSATSQGSRGRTALPNELDQPDSGGNTAITSADAQALLRQQIGFGFGGLILLMIFSCIVFGFWWNRLFRRYSIATQLYGRICLLAGWAGIKVLPSQTPYEYMQAVAAHTPNEAATLERLGDIYVRDLWADPQSAEHPRRSGEVGELPGIWKYLQPRLFFYTLRHPHFLHWLPSRIWGFMLGFWKNRRMRKLAEEEL